jgi:hypothetical protein
MLRKPSTVKPRITQDRASACVLQPPQMSEQYCALGPGVQARQAGGPGAAGGGLHKCGGCGAGADAAHPEVRRGLEHARGRAPTACSLGSSDRRVSRLRWWSWVAPHHLLADGTYFRALGGTRGDMCRGPHARLAQSLIAAYVTAAEHWAIAACSAVVSKYTWVSGLSWALCAHP